MGIGVVCLAGSDVLVIRASKSRYSHQKKNINFRTILIINNASPYSATPIPSTGTLVPSRPPRMDRIPQYAACDLSPISMAKCGRADELLPPSFTSLPDIAHHTIASFIPDGDTRICSRLRVSEVSHALFDSYGGGLTSASLLDIEDGTADHLAALLRRQKMLKIMFAEGRSTLISLSHAITQGCCQGVESIHLRDISGSFNLEIVDILTGALQVDGALPALKKLNATINPEKCGYTILSKLARALMGGSLPLLEDLGVRESGHSASEDNLSLVADVVEARKHIPGYHALKQFHANYSLLRNDSVSQVTKIRLLRALLPSFKDLTYSRSDAAALNACILEMRPPFLETLDIWLRYDETPPSHEVLEAAASLKTISIWTHFNAPTLTAAAFQPVIAALQRGIGLRNLQSIEVWCCALGDAHFCEFLEALEYSGCAKQMVELSFPECRICVEGACALASLHRRDGLPALEVMGLSSNDGIGDEGIVPLARALCEAPLTILRHLNLQDVGLGNEGMAALASVIDQGRMGRTEYLDLSAGRGVTDDGIITLAKAIDARKLPEVRFLSVYQLHKTGLTTLGLDAICQASVNSCPKLVEFYMDDYPDARVRYCIFANTSGWTAEAKM